MIYYLGQKTSAFDPQTGKHGSTSMHDCTGGVRDGGGFLEERWDVVLDLTDGRLDQLEVRPKTVSE